MTGHPRSRGPGKRKGSPGTTPPWTLFLMIKLSLSLSLSLSLPDSESLRPGPAPGRRGRVLLCFISRTDVDHVVS